MEFTQEQKVYTEVVQRAWEDAEFKKSLIANPVEVIEKFTGKKVNLPEGKTLVVIDESETKNNKPEDGKTYFVIPEAKHGDFELTEEELEKVAGGISVVFNYDKDNNYTGWSLELTLF